MDKREELLNLFERALEEMKQNWSTVLMRGDKILKSDLPKYGPIYHELVLTRILLEQGGEVSKVIRHKNVNIFNPYESFFMDLFETNSFPILFELYEYE